MMTTTFLFTDIEGSTRQWEEQAEMADRIGAHFDLLHAVVESAGGEVFATMGDGIAAAFPSAAVAVDAAVLAQRRLTELGLSVRMGLHSGEVERVEGDYRGRPVNRAARVMAAGHGGQILLSDLTSSLVRQAKEPVEVRDLGPVQLRDVPEPERLWQVVAPELEVTFPPVRTAASLTHNLPATRASIVGRESEIRRVTELLRDHRLVSLTGVGGVGKTRLAVRSAEAVLGSFDRVWFVELANVVDPDDVADAVARALGACGLVGPVEAIEMVLAGCRTLLVVDNCEHVIDEAAALVDRLLGSCPTLTVMTTSREAIGIDGEHVVAVRPLDLETTAVELFTERAEAAGAPPTSLDRSLVAAICRQLDGIPLAIELAAARVATLGTGAVLDALDGRFSGPAGGRRLAIDRHSTMTATIDWSYRLLDRDERRMFEWLAVFSNGFELDAARHVAREMGLDAPTATSHVASLVHKSLLSSEITEHGIRYRMLESMRAFALDRLDEHEERTAAAIAHAEWVATLTDLPVTDPCNATVERHALRLEREADNWRDAVMLAARRRDGELAARLCGPPAAYFLLGRHDLADHVRPMLNWCGRGTARRSVLVALIVASAGVAPTAEIDAWVAEVTALDAAAPTGVGGLMTWMALAWRWDFEGAVAVCVGAARDPRLPQASRDLFVGIASLDHFSLIDPDSDPHGLLPSALEVAARTDVAMHRVTCLLAAAWAVASVDPDRAVQLVGRARRDLPLVPPLTRASLPGNASRLLARLDPRIAAEGLLDQLESAPVRRSFVDLIPIFYAAALLHRVGHPDAHRAAVPLASRAGLPFVSMMDCVGLARRAAADPHAMSLADLERVVRAALHQLVDEPAPEVLADAMC